MTASTTIELPTITASGGPPRDRFFCCRDAFGGRRRRFDFRDGVVAAGSSNTGNPPPPISGGSAPDGIVRASPATLDGWSTSCLPPGAPESDSSATQRADVPCRGVSSAGDSASSSSTSSGSARTNVCRQLGQRPFLPSNERSGNFRMLPHSGQGICIDAMDHPDH